MQAGFDPDSFWQQSPIHFQIAMRGVRRRLELEEETQLVSAWHIASLTARTQTKEGLPKLDELLKRLRDLRRREANPGARQSYSEMLANMRILAARQNAIHHRMTKEAKNGDAAR
ncbi:MAG: hypothetical protein AAF650_04895 [Pseudomonadota bacterium]